MTDTQVQSDMQYLTGSLEHRGANTNNEREAAEYIQARMRQYTPSVDLDDFYSPDGAGFLAPSYFAEFAIVSLVAVWWPLAALVYGGIVFTFYLAESSGYSVLAHLMPKYETQNVVARFLSPRPQMLFVVMAHYDSAKDKPLTYPKPPVWLRPGHILMVFCMFLVLATCAVELMDVLPPPEGQINIWVRWVAVALLLVGAGVLIRNEMGAQNTKGVNDNATGVTALLRLAHNLSVLPIKEADVYLVATGSNQTGMHGAQHFIKSYSVDPENTYFLCLDSVGIGGTLAYVTELGLVQVCKPPQELVLGAAAAGEQFNAVEASLVTPHSDAMLLLSRGYKAIEITAVDEPEEPDDDQGQRAPRDTRLYRNQPIINPSLIAGAADFAEATLRRLVTDMELAMEGSLEGP